MGFYLNNINSFFLSKIAAGYGFIGKTLNTSSDKKYWKKHAPFWHTYKPPAQPSEEDLLNYKSYLKDCGKKVSCILLLGSTPGLRDLLSDYYPTAKIYVADYSPAMLTHATRALKKANPSKEIWIKSHWLELPFPENYFDAILGDRVLEQFSPETQEKFLTKIKSLLAPEGSFIIRCRTLNDGVRNKSTQEIFNDTLKNYNGKKNFNFASTFIWRLKDKFTDPASLRIDYASIIKDLKEFRKKEDCGKEFLVMARKFIEDLKEFPTKWAYSVPPQKALSSLFSRYFYNLRFSTSNDYIDASYYLIFHLKK